MKDSCLPCPSYLKCKGVQDAYNFTDREMELLEVAGRDIASQGQSTEKCHKIISLYTQDKEEQKKLMFFVMGIEYTFHRFLDLDGKATVKIQKDSDYGLYV